jgi:hypothetical protein
MAALETMTYTASSRIARITLDRFQSRVGSRGRRCHDAPQR